jgi:hypothetical protein
VGRKPSTDQAGDLAELAGLAFELCALEVRVPSGTAKMLRCFLT